MIRRPLAFGSLCLAVLFAASGCVVSSTGIPSKGMFKQALEGAAVGTPIGCAMAGAIDYDDLLNYAIGCGGGALVGAVVGSMFVLPPPPPPPPPVAQAAPPPPPPPPPPAKPAIKEKVVLRGVHFDFDKSDVRPEDEPVLDEAVQVLKQESGMRIYVDGYCDAIGSEEYNQKLSERRASAVAGYLEEQGITAGRLIARGFGKTHFVATNDTDAGRAENRRVELIPAE